MKQVLFILLVFISFQGFSQSVKMNISYNIEVMKTDLGEMTWDEAKTACEKLELGGGWRLPTMEELKIIYKKRNKIGGFTNGWYWSSTELDDGNDAGGFGFSNGDVSQATKIYSYYVRAVRTIIK